MNVYILTKTEYSLTDIIGVYDTLEKAKKKLDKWIYKLIIGVCAENRLESLYKTKKNCIRILYDKAIIYMKNNHDKDIYDSEDSDEDSDDSDEDSEDDSEDSNEDSEDDSDKDSEDVKDGKSDEKYIEKILRLRLKISIVKELLKEIITINNYLTG